jgi:TM2 domain-containing membrane protein YozV
MEDPDDRLHGCKTRRLTKEALPSDGKNPAAAYTLSLFFWGWGQLYNDQRAKGLLFLFAMVMVVMVPALALVYWNSFLNVLRSYAISNADAFLTAEILFFSVLIFWMYNAGDAYHKAVKARILPFAGVQSHAYPFLCSLLMPGWGQFLNGQPIKGSIFSGLSILSIFSLVSIPSVLVIWPSLEAVRSRFIIEEIFALTVLFAPLMPFLWLIGSFDALKVSLDEIKKESFVDRIKYANNRRRTQGWMRGVYPHIKLTVFLVLFLIFFARLSYHSFPKNYYSGQIAVVQVRLQELGMTIVPEMIGHCFRSGH